MSENNFVSPSRQSAKGIIVIFALSVYNFIKRILIFFAVFIFRFLDYKDTKVIIGIIVFIVAFIIFSVLKYLNFKFYVTKDYFILNQGILTKDKTSIAKSKIQNVYIKQNVVQQLLNVVSLAIETAGDNITEIEIKALARPKAEALKQELIQNRVIDNIIIDERQETVYYSASIKKLLLEGITENHIKSSLFILAFIASIYSDLKDIIKNTKLDNSFGNWFLLEQEEVVTSIVFNLFLMVCLLFASFLFSLIKIMVINYNLKIKEIKGGLEISKGLLNKISLNLVPTRIQNTTISTNFLKQKLNLYKLSFKQTLINKKQQDSFTIIGLDKVKVQELVNKFYPKILDNPNKNKPEHYFYRIKIIQAIVFICLINIPLYFAPRVFLFLNIIIVLYHVFSIPKAFKKAYYSIDNEYLIIGKGTLIETKTELLELHKIQTVEFKQSIFQKPRAIASINIYSASKKITIPYIKTQQALLIYNYLLYKIESKEKDWM